MFGWFKKKQETVSSPDGPYDTDDIPIQDELARVMRGHGLAVQPHDDWLVVGDDPPLLRGICKIDGREDDGVTTQLDIELRLSAERSIWEHYAGRADNAREAMGQGLFKFGCGTFQVFLSAYWDHHDADQVEVERWTIDGAPWDAYVGNTVNNTSEGQPASTPHDYLTTVQTALTALSLTPEDHWLSFYAANLKGELTTEARFDNDVWTDLGQAIGQLAWTPAEGFYSTRNFILLRPARA